MPNSLITEIPAVMFSSRYQFLQSASGTSQRKASCIKYHSTCIALIISIPNDTWEQYKAGTCGVITLLLVSSQGRYFCRNVRWS